MTRIDDGDFSIDLPDGWDEISDELTYSDPNEGARRMFGREGAAGILYVSLLPLDPEDPPRADRPYAEGLAQAWGRARGRLAAVSISSQLRADGALACAEYKLSVDYVSVWYLASDEGTLHASYVCAWGRRDEDRAACDAMIASLSFVT